MSLYDKAEPAGQQQFRDNTSRQAGSMENVTTIPGREFCVCCEKIRTKATGIRTAIGFMCHSCSQGGRK